MAEVTPCRDLPAGVAFASGNGTWTVTNEPAADFSDLAAIPGVIIFQV